MLQCLVSWEGLFMDMESLWNNFLTTIKESVSALSYETWFRDTKLVSLRDNSATVVVPMPVHKKHLLENYKDIIEEKFTQITSSTFNFNFLLEEEWAIQKEKINETIKTSIPKKEISTVGVPVQSFEDANLNKDYTFNNFIVGSSNRFAFTASMAVAEKPGKAYNPLFLYGKSGLGKTHLMHSIGNYILENTNLRVLYISSDKFVNDFINAVRYNEKENFEKIDIFKSK